MMVERLKESRVDGHSNLQMGVDGNFRRGIILYVLPSQVDNKYRSSLVSSTLFLERNTETSIKP